MPDSFWNAAASAVRDLLNISAWKTTALAIAAGFLLYGNSKRWFPVALQSWLVEAAVVVLIVCSCLSLAAIIPNGIRLAERSYVWKRTQAGRFLAHAIPEMSDTEREIISYLVAHNQRMFETQIDGGYASTLIAKGLIVCAVRPGQSVRSHGVPFEVPKPVWDALIARKDEFRYKASKHAERVAPPWVIPWEVR